jgi:hypothetical protein
MVYNQASTNPRRFSTDKGKAFVKRILVTGSHRSGTTWVGKILSIPRNVEYIHEPFNPNIASKYNLPIKKWFTYIPDIGEKKDFFRIYKKIITLSWYPSYPDSYNWHFAMRCSIRDRLRGVEKRVFSQAVLIKDPIALLSAEQLADKYALRVVCMIRHPLAFCSSIKKWNWTHPFRHFLEQPILMNEHFSDYSKAISEFANKEKPTVDQAILLWNLLHSVIKKHQDDHKDWIFLRHEDVVQNPLEVFEDVYGNLGLNYSKDCVDQIKNSLSDREKDAMDPSFRARNPLSVTDTWKLRLSDDEIRQILSSTQALRTHFYGD